MDEKLLEEIICKHPELIEHELSLIGNQVYLSGKRVDVLFEDKHDQKLIIEVKKGTILREHISQLLDYEGYFVSKNNPDVRVMLVGTRVPENLRRSLDHHGFEWKELTIPSLINFLNRVGDDVLLSRFAQEDVEIYDSAASFPSKKNYRKPWKKPEQELLQVQNPDELINKLLDNNSCKKFRSEELSFKIDRELKAWRLIQEYRGRYTQDNLTKIFNTVNKDTHNKNWFGHLLATPNLNLIFSHPVELINKWIEILLFEQPGPVTSMNKCINDIKIKGARNGLISLLFYLSNPVKYNVWLPSTENAIVILGMIDCFHGNDYSSYYVNFNEAVILIRDKFKLLPQEVDWLLSFIPSYINGKDFWYYK